MAELHRRPDGEPSSHHSMQITTTASIPTNNIMVFPRIYYNLGKPIILLVNLKSGKSITISLESSHGGNLKVDTTGERNLPVRVYYHEIHRKKNILISLTPYFSTWNS